MRALLVAYYSTFANTIYLSPFFISERQVKVGLKTRSSLGIGEVKRRFLTKQWGEAGALPGFFKRRGGGVTEATPSGDRRLYMVNNAALPRVGLLLS